jgi:hypothetical protein
MSTDEEPGASGLERRSRALLEDSAANLDGRVRSRLTQARHAAVAAALLGALIYVRNGPGVLPASAPAANGAEDLELLADADALQLAEDAGDYEFYEWAAANASEAEAVGT